VGTKWRRGNSVNVPVDRKVLCCGGGVHTLLAEGESTQLQLQALLPPAPCEYQEHRPTEMQDPWIYMDHTHSTELAKAGEKEVQLQTPILQKGDGVSDVSKMPSSGVHSSQCSDPPCTRPEQCRQF